MRWSVAVFGVIMISGFVAALRGVNLTIEGIALGSFCGALFGLAVAQWRCGVVETPNHKLFAAIGALAGIAIGTGVITLFGMTNNFYLVVGCFLAGVLTVICVTIMRLVWP